MAMHERGTMTPGYRAFLDKQSGIPLVIRDAVAHLREQKMFPEAKLGMRVCVFIYICVCMHVCGCMCVCMHVCVCMHACVCNGTSHGGEDVHCGKTGFVCVCVVRICVCVCELQLYILSNTHSQAQQTPLKTRHRHTTCRFVAHTRTHTRSTAVDRHDRGKITRGRTIPGRGVARNGVRDHAPQRGECSVV
jgi:hypothetical protein